MLASPSDRLTRKLRAYLEELSPRARETLLKAVRSAEAKGDGDPTIALVLAAARGLEAPQAAAAPGPSPAPALDLDRLAEAAGLFGDVAPPAPKAAAATPAAATPPAPPPAAAAPPVAVKADPKPAPAAPPAPPAPAPAPSRSYSGAAIVDHTWSTRLRDAFFAPVEPFLTDVAIEPHQRGRIDRQAMEPIWVWLGRDVVPNEIDRALAIGAGGGGDVGKAASGLRVEVLHAIQTRHGAQLSDPRHLQRLSAQIGGEENVDDLRDVIHVLERQEALERFFQRLPRQITVYDAAETGAVTEAVRFAIGEGRIDAAFAASGVLSRANSANVLTALAMRLMGTEDARVLFQSGLAPFVDVVLSDLERMAAAIRRDLQTRADVNRIVETIRAYHEVVRHLTVTLDLDTTATWSKRLAACRRVISEVIAAEIEPSQGYMRRAMRAGSDRGVRFDSAAAEDAERALKVLNAARAAIDSLALNELVTRTRKNAEQTLEVLANKSIDELRQATGSDRDAWAKATEAACTFSALVLGEDYANVLRKARENALGRSMKLVG